MIDLFDISQSNDRLSQGVIKGFVKSFCHYKSLACFGSSASSVRSWGVTLKPDLREESQVTFLWDHKRYNFRPAAELNVYLDFGRRKKRKGKGEGYKMQKRREVTSMPERVFLCLLMWIWIWCCTAWGTRQKKGFFLSLLHVPVDISQFSPSTVSQDELSTGRWKSWRTHFQSVFICLIPVISRKNKLGKWVRYVLFCLLIFAIGSKIVFSE